MHIWSPLGERLCHSKENSSGGFSRIWLPTSETCEMPSLYCFCMIINVSIHCQIIAGLCLCNSYWSISHTLLVVFVTSYEFHYLLFYFASPSEELSMPPSSWSTGNGLHMLPWTGANFWLPEASFCCPMKGSEYYVGMHAHNWKQAWFCVHKLNFQLLPLYVLTGHVSRLTLSDN